MDFNILVFISGRGSNLLSLIQHAEKYKVSGILSDKTDAPGLRFGTEFGIPVHIFDRKSFDSISSMKSDIQVSACALNPNLICLAGFMQIVTPELIKEFPNRILNIHPSLLPKFPGLDTHKRAIESGERVHGCTVHIVDAGIDTGPVIARAEVPLRAGESEESISRRVLTREHELYPWVINSIATGDIKLSSGRVNFTDKARGEAQKRNFKLPYT